MRLIDFINEKAWIERIKDYNVILDILNKDCKNNWEDFKKNGPKIWRGDHRIISPGIFLHHNKYTRRSANTFNHYTLLFSELLSSWKNIPPRNKALICTTDINYATEYSSNYDNIFAVIPYDNVTIGETNKADIWNLFDSVQSKYNFVDTTFDLNKFNVKLNVLVSDDKSELINFIDMNLYDFLTKNKKHFINKKSILFFEMILKFSLNISFNNKQEIDTFLENYDNNLEEFKDKLIKHKMKDVFNFFLSPKALGVTTTSYSSLPKKDQEIWVAGPAVLISHSKLNDVKNFI